MKLHRTRIISVLTGMGIFRVGLWLFFAPSFCFLFSELQHTEDFRSSLNFQKYGLGQENPTQNFQKYDQGQDRRILPRNQSPKLLPELQETHTQMETLKISTLLRKVIGNKSKYSCISSEQLCACLIGKGLIMIDLYQNQVLKKFYDKKPC